MPTWPRDVVPARSSYPTLPRALQSWGQSGRGQTRATGAFGRVWTESYPILDLGDPVVRGFLQLIDAYAHGGTSFDVEHYDLRNNAGAGGGSPLVMGAGQFGASLVVDGAPATTTNWLRRGDLIRVAGVPAVLSVDGDVDTDGGGVATIPVYPPIPEGSEPADNAVVTIAGVKFVAVLYESPLPQLGELGVVSELEGLTLTFREVL